MSFTKETHDTLMDDARRIMDTSINVYNLLAGAHQSLESIYADAIRCMIPDAFAYGDADKPFNDAITDVQTIRDYVTSKMKGLEATPEYKTMQSRIDDYALYVQGLHMLSYAVPEDEYLYRGAYCATFEEHPKLEGLEKWNFNMAKLLSEWNFWQATLATTHGYPDRLLLGRDAVYGVLDDYATRTIQLYNELEYTEETAPVLEHAAKAIKKLNHNNVELLLGSIYEKNYFKNKEGSDNDDNRRIKENTDKNEPQIHSDNME